MNTVIFNYNEIINADIPAITKITKIATALNGAIFQFVASGDMSQADTSIKVFYRPNYLHMSDKTMVASCYCGTIDESNLHNIISLYDYNQKWAKGVDIIFVDPFYIKQGPPETITELPADASFTDIAKVVDLVKTVGHVAIIKMGNRYIKATRKFTYSRGVVATRYLHISYMGDTINSLNNKYAKMQYKECKDGSFKTI